MNFTLAMQMATDLVLVCVAFISATRIKKLEADNACLRNRADALQNALKGAIDNQNQRITDLEKGIVPDYEAAKKANKELTDFSKGISALLSFDPYAALHKDDEEE